VSSGALFFAGVGAFVCGCATVLTGFSAFVGFLGFLFAHAEVGGGDECDGGDQYDDFLHGITLVVVLLMADARTVTKPCLLASEKARLKIPVRIGRKVLRCWFLMIKNSVAS
jgi:uncharacterized membrane protein